MRPVVVIPATHGDRWLSFKRGARREGVGLPGPARHPADQGRGKSGAMRHAGSGAVRPKRHPGPGWTTTFPATPRPAPKDVHHSRRKPRGKGCHRASGQIPRTALFGMWRLPRDRASPHPTPKRRAGHAACGYPARQPCRRVSPTRDPADRAVEPVVVDSFASSVDHRAPTITLSMAAHCATGTDGASIVRLAIGSSVTKPRKPAGPVGL